MFPGYIVSLHVIFTSCVLVLAGVNPPDDINNIFKINDTGAENIVVAYDDFVTQSASLDKSGDINVSTVVNGIQYNVTDIENIKASDTVKNNDSSTGKHNYSDTEWNNNSFPKMENISNTGRNNVSSTGMINVSVTGMINVPVTGMNNFSDVMEFNVTNHEINVNHSNVSGVDAHREVVENNTSVFRQDISYNSTGNNVISNVKTTLQPPILSITDEKNASDSSRYNHTAKQKHNVTTNRLQHTITTVSVAPDFKKKTTYRLNANLPFHVPYMIHGESAEAKNFFLEGSKRATLQHHLQLVPMEDEPLGAMMAKDQRYVISVLVPIAIGVFGAALIAGTVFSLRYVARRRAFDTPVDDEFDTERDHEACIPSISGETTDKMFLLMGDDE
ncbi:hypothetical protein ACF0H5_003154 [Mactra antiquata]